MSGKLTKLKITKKQNRILNLNLIVVKSREKTQNKALVRELLFPMSEPVKNFFQKFPVRVHLDPCMSKRAQKKVTGKYMTTIGQTHFASRIIHFGYFFSPFLSVTSVAQSIKFSLLRSDLNYFLEKIITSFYA